MGKTVKLLSVLCLITIAFASQAQVTVKVDIKIEEQLRIKNALIDSTRIEGYRIQIAFSSNQSEANSSESKFKSRFPAYSSRVYRLYQQPYWKIRIGDYYREIDAQKMLKDVRVYFPNAFLVKDNIRRPIIN